MNKRIVSMIQDFSRPEKIISIASLSEKYQISQRTVRNDLNSINDLLKKYHLETLILEKGGVIVRQEDFPQLLPYIEEKDFYDYKLSKEERKKIASVLLITAQGFITLSDIADYMAVSRATVIHDLDEIKAYIKSGNLEVCSHANKGLRVQGLESDKRVFLLRLVQYNPETAREDVVRKQIGVDEETRDVLGKILYEQEHVHESFLNDFSFQKMIAYLEIMTSRIQKEEYLETQVREKNSKYEMAEDVLNYVSQYCQIEVTEDEIQFLSALLKAGNYIKQKYSDKDSIKIQMTARAFIEAVSEELNLNLNGDYAFFENLSNHLENSMSEVWSEYEKNPVIEKVVEENKEVRQAVEHQKMVIEQYAGREMGKTELDYLTVHVCAAIERKKNKETSFQVVVACHAGIGTSYLLLEKLKKHFHFSIRDIVSSHEARNLKPKQADFVISTVPLKDCKLEYVIVSPLLSDEDYMQIANLMERLRESRVETPADLNVHKNAQELIGEIAPVVYESVPEKARELLEQIGKIVLDYFDEVEKPDEEWYSPCLYQLLSPSHIQLDISCTDWRDAVRKSAEKLLEEDYIEARYIDAMIQNIEENGPYVVLSKGFALPHEGVEEGCKKLGMNLIRLSPPVEFDAEERDPVEFVCSLSAIDHNTHLKAFFHLVNLLKNETFKEELRQSRTSEELCAVIKKWELDLREDD